MRVLAPVGNFESALKQMNAGATEIYLGGASDIFDYFTYSARMKYSLDGKNEKKYLDREEIKRITEIAHERNVKVMHTANLQFLANDPSGSKNYEKYFLEYVDQGIDAGVDSIILSDIGAIMLLRQKGYDIHITASTLFETITKEQLLFFKELGVNRVVISYQGSISDIEELCKCNLMEIEVFAHDGCSFYDGHCNFTHTKKTGIPCHNNYKLYDGDFLVGEGPIIKAFQTCSLCSLARLKKAGVCSIKLVGRELDSDRNIEITRIYTELLAAIDAMEENDGIETEEIKKMRLELLPDWWQRVFCKQKVCRYKNNKISNAFI